MYPFITGITVTFLAAVISATETVNVTAMQSSIIGDVVTFRWLLAGSEVGGNQYSLETLLITCHTWQINEQCRGRNSLSP
jgi:hypothetical protein